MNTKMTVFITVKGKINSLELYERIKDYGANVTDLIDKTYVYAIIDIKEDAIEHILTICDEYGECDVEAHRVKEDKNESNSVLQGPQQG